MHGEHGGAQHHDRNRPVEEHIKRRDESAEDSDAGTKPLTNRQLVSDGQQPAPVVLDEAIDVDGDTTDATRCTAAESRPRGRAGRR